MKLTDEQIQIGLDKAYKEAGQNAYFGAGFCAGIKFAQEHGESKSSTQICYKTSDLNVIIKKLK